MSQELIQLFALLIGFIVPLLFLIIVLKNEIRQLILFFAWGFMATMLAYILLKIKINPAEFRIIYQVSIEELLKALPLFILLFRKNKFSQFSIEKFAFASGIGFSIYENFFYVLKHLDINNPILLFIIIFTRGFSTALTHGITTSIIGFGIYLCKKLECISIFILCGTFIFAVQIHLLYNLLLSLSGNVYMAYLVFLIPIIMFCLEYFVFNFFGFWKGFSLYKEQIQE